MSTFRGITAGEDYSEVSLSSTNVNQSFHSSDLIISGIIRHTLLRWHASSVMSTRIISKD